MHKVFIKLRVTGQTSVIPADKASIRPNPKSAVWVTSRPVDCCVRQVLTRRRLPGDAAITVESKQAEFRAKPKITIRRLGNRVDIALEEPIPNGPGGVRVLANLQRGAQRESARQQQASRITIAMAVLLCALSMYI